MDGCAGDLPHWTRYTPGVTGPRPSKRGSTISLEDPYLASHEICQTIQHDPDSGPSTFQHSKSALGLLIPQEVYHYDPSPPSSPNVECPILPKESPTVDKPLQQQNPLQTYLGTHDNNELRMMGLPPHYNSFDQLPRPAEERDSNSLDSSTSVLSSGWRVIESPQAIESTSKYSSDHSKAAWHPSRSESVSTWYVVESPGTFDTQADRSGPAAVGLSQSQTHHGWTTPAGIYGEPLFRTGTLGDQANHDARRLVATTAEPDVSQDEPSPCMQAASSLLRSQSSVEGDRKMRSNRRLRVRMHRSRTKIADSTP